MSRLAPRLALLLALACALAPAAARAWEPDPAVLRRLERMDQRRERRLASSERPGAPAPGSIGAPEGSRLLSDARYGPEERQRADVYLPPNASGAPAILFVFSEAWARGDKADPRAVPDLAKRLLSKGYALVSIEHRLGEWPNVLEQARDVERALAWAQAQAPAWGADPERFILMGLGSGAHLVALANADPSEALSLGARPWLGAVALESPAYDAEQIMTRDRRDSASTRAFGNDPARWRLASPTQRLRRGAPPMLLACSSFKADGCEQARAFERRARGLGSRADVFAVPTARLSEARGSVDQAVDSFLRSLGAP